MKDFYFCVIALMLTNPVAANVLSPPASSPLRDTVILKYVAGFKEECTATSTGTNGTHSVVGERSINLMPDGRTAVNVRQSPVSAVFFVNNDGVSLSPPSLNVDKNAPEDLASTVKNLIIYGPRPSEGIVGVQFRQGIKLALQAECGSTTGIKPRFEKRYVTALGIANIRGRQSLILNSENQCSIDSTDGIVNFDIRGWESYDLQSGLPSDAYFSNAIREGSRTIAEYESRIQCIFVGESTEHRQSLPEAQSRSNEQRLFELKSLFDKGLITTEQFEKKRLEIVDGL